MQKTFRGYSARGSDGRLIQTLLRVMRLTILLLTIGCLHVSANGLGQIVSFSGKNVSLESVFKEVEKQTGYVFLYSNNVVEVSKPVSISVSKMSLIEFLERIFINQPLSYEVDKKSILVTPKQDSQLTSDIFKPKTIADTLIDVNGRVIGENGEPLVGVNVLIKGTSKGTVTDVQGVFIFKQVQASAILSFSYVGYVNKDINANNPAIHRITLIRSESKLDEVQVQAYGTTTRRFNTGNIGTLKAVDIEKQPVTNPLQALQGRLPGVDIAPVSGLPNAAIKVRIQGINSLSSGGDPLYIVDGVPYPSQMVETSLNAGVLGRSGTGIQGNAGNPLSFLNPSDIESIDVLKDAAATAIYGSRAGNGAVLITTKKGKVGSATINLNVQSGWSTMPNRVEMMNSSQYVSMRKEAFKNDNLLMTPTNAYDILNLNGWDTTRNTDWQDVLLGGASSFTNAQATITGGNAFAQYLVGLGYNRQTTITPGDFANQKGSLHFNLNSVSGNQRFKSQLTGNAMLDDNRLQNVDLAGLALSLSPTAPSLLNDDGTTNWALDAAGNSSWPSQQNPLALLNSRFRGKTQNLVLNLTTGYQILKGWDISIAGGYNSLRADEVITIPLSTVAPALRPGGARRATYANNLIQSWTLEPQTRIEQNIGGGKLDILIGATIQQTNTNGVRFEGSGYVSDALMEDMRSAAVFSPAATINNVYRYNALFGRINYTLRNRYIVDLTARRDGSSNFGPANRFHNFGAIGSAWIFSEENFFKSKLRFLSFGKLRGSFGTTGNDQIGSYSFLDLYSSWPASISYLNQSALMISQLFNPNLQWEETRKLSLGLDLGFAKDRILFTATFARNRSSNQLTNYTLPITAGIPTIRVNLPALIQNTNWEFSLNASPIKQKKFSWLVSANGTLPRNKLVAYDNIERTSDASRVIVGESIEGNKLFHFLGMNPSTGKWVFADLNGNPVETPDYNQDRTIFTSTVFRKWYGGLNNSFKFKAFQLDLHLQFVSGNSVGYYGNLANFGNVARNQPLTALERWQKPGDISYFPRFTTRPVTTFYFTSSDAGVTEFTFVRFQNISLSYSLPATFLSKTHLKQARVFLNGQNLAFWSTKSKYVGFDPETGGSAGTPALRTLVAGINLSF